MSVLAAERFRKQKVATIGRIGSPGDGKLTVTVTVISSMRATENLSVVSRKTAGISVARSKRDEFNKVTFVLGSALPRT